MNAKTPVLVLCCIAALGLLGQTRPAPAPKLMPVAEEFKIEDYSFTWNVLKAGDAKLQVEKTKDATTICLASGYDYLRLLPEEATAIGAVLAKTDRYAARLAGAAEEKSISLNAGRHDVMFWQSPKYGFGIRIGETDAFSMSCVYLSRQQARLLAPSLAKGARMAAFVDRKIMP